MTTATTLRQEIESNFSKNKIDSAVEPHSNELSLEQIWTIVKLCKYVRLRARNNAAFNNLFNQLFPYANFKQVAKKKLDGSTYPGLSIMINGKELDVNSEGEE